MTNITHINKDGLPSTKSLIKATVAAGAAASVILLTTVLPAEYGIDPTGIGKALGLTVLNEANDAELEELPVKADLENLILGSAAPVWKGQEQPRSDTMTLTLLPRQGAEIKSPMEQGDNFIFHWKAEGGTVYFDMHGEPPSAGKDEFTSYWIGKEQQQASGNFTAPFAGTHGWYWQNTGTEPVTIKLTTTGFYGDLYMP
ncbi:hypothetical protein [Neptuniibacter halophilus]|uniref:hypothetical protein n=1 Tax=Neptuniibacter halophilus TaxID=651666 RepID=UPI0025732B2C|nr:hypothetical protein [Neptuniibacter halophilus]